MRHAVMAIVLSGGVIWLIWQANQAGWTPMRWAGLLLVVPGYLLWATAHWQLGRSFSIAPEARRLVTTGLYSRFRNPIYYFGSLVIAGGFLLLGQPWLLLLFLVIVPMQVLRARREARVLEDAFGDDYRAYRAKTWF